MQEPIELSAGPLRMRLEEGELRYIKIGDAEIVRRIYFAVRTGEWATVSPRFELYNVQNSSSSFRVSLKAVCKGIGGADYTWNGEIEGRSDGSISFHATGVANVAMKSNRIGLCVLLGTPTVCNESYVALSPEGRRIGGTFPEFVNAPLMFEPNFTEIIVSPSDSQKIVVGLTQSSEAIFSMEDQRNFGDSSFKAYAPLKYAYPDVRAGETYSETVTLSTTGFPSRTSTKRAAVLDFSEGPGGFLPKLAVPSPEGRNFFEVNHDREKTRTGSAVAFPFTPHTHLSDDDTAWENLASLPEQVASARKIAPGKPIDISQLTLGISRRGSAPDPRRASPFGAAWLAAFLGEAALAGVRSVGAPPVGSGHSDRIVALLGPLAGQRVVMAAFASYDLTSTVSGYSVGPNFVVVNRTARRVTVAVTGLGKDKLSSVSLDGTTAPSAIPKSGSLTPGSGGRKKLTLAPYEILFLSPLH